MIAKSEPKFGKWRQRLWPIHSFELRKLLPLLLIKFLISVNYQILTCLKDTLIVTSKGSGAEVIPVLKGYVVLPVAILVTIIYSKLSNILSKKGLFYAVMSSFFILIFLCTFVLLPNLDFFSPSSSADWLTQFFGGKFTHWIAIYRNWVQSMFFVTAELWGSLVILVIFWGFANDITNIREAKRTYNLYIASGNLAAWLMGIVIGRLTTSLAHKPFIHTSQSLLSLFLILTIAIIGLYWWMHKYALKENDFIHATDKKTKKKFSLKESFRHLITSKYLMGVAVMVVGYGLTINLVEITWKANVKNLFPNASDYQHFMSNTTAMVGFVAFLTSFFFGETIIRRFGWKTSAQITPIFVGLVGLIFFVCSYYHKDLFGPFTSPLYILAIFGALHNILSKVCKYSFFDPTKEMAYIPLDNEEKVKGKAAIDIIGSRLGKSGSSWIQVALIDLMGVASILSVSHFLIPIILLATASWIYSVSNLSKRFYEKERLAQH
jgi:ATP:ADP antiporter, AAA family